MRTIITILFLLLSLRLSSPPGEDIIVIRDEVINPYETGFVATCTVESKNNIAAYSEAEQAHSIVQIRTIRLKDYNERTGSDYTTSDLYDFAVSRKIYMYYASKIDYHNPEKIAREWNGWRNGMKKQSTLRYWEKISEAMIEKL